MGERFGCGDALRQRLCVHSLGTAAGNSTGPKLGWHLFQKKGPKLFRLLNYCRQIWISSVLPS